MNPEQQRQQEPQEDQPKSLKALKQKSLRMRDAAIHDEVKATLTWLQKQHPELKPLLQKAYGYAVFPAMGRASVVLGGAFGRGEVFERGKSIGFATLSQMTIGVQVGGQTFRELMLFSDKDALEAFKRGKVSFTANASAVLVKGGGSGTSDPARVTAKAYTRGGMLLEASIGGQKFTLQNQGKRSTPSEEGEPGTERGEGHEGDEGAEAKTSTEPEQRGEPQQAEPRETAAAKRGDGAPERRSEGSAEVAQEAQEAQEVQDEPTAPKQHGRLARAALRLVGGASSKAAHVLEARKAKKRGPLGRAASALHLVHDGPLDKLQAKLTSIGDKAALVAVLDEEAIAALSEMKEKDRGLATMLEKAYGYAVFPAVGKATAVVGGSYGRGEVFEQGKLIGYAAIVQLTLGVQLGGQTFNELILFDNPGALEEFKTGRVQFAANASAVIVKAGLAATSSYAAGTHVFVQSEGGLMLELAIGGQKFVYRPKTI